MKSHLSLSTNGRPLALKPDAEISIEELNPLFNTVELKSFPFELPITLNRSIFKNVDARDSALRTTDIEGMPIRVALDGIPYRSAVLHVEQNQVIDGTLPVNLDSRTKTFRDMIEDLKCRDLEKEVAADRIIIGEKIGDIEFEFTYQVFASLAYWIDRGESGSDLQTEYYKITDSITTHKQTFTPPATGFSYPGRCSDWPTRYPEAAKTLDYGDGHQRIVPVELDSFINVSTPYPQAKYCNTRMAYAHYGVETDDNGVQKTSSDIIDYDKAKYQNEDYSPYWVLDAKRPSSGICFYVGYFLEKLFQHLGVAFDMAALTNIEDFNYMCFVTTACKYREEMIPYIAPVGQDIRLPNETSINEWLRTRGCDGRVKFEHDKFGIVYESKANSCTKAWLDNYVAQIDPVLLYSYDKSACITNYSMKAYVNRMFATAENFPDATVSEVIESLENTFGVRFVYDPEINKVTVKLLRDVFRSTATPIHLKGQVLSMRKMSEKITGVRVKYSGESDEEEQRENVRKGIRDYDTDYDYIDYPVNRTQIKDYKEMMKRINVQDMNVYVDPATGDAFRIKVDSEATTAKEMRPTAFEVGQYKGIEVGDCSKDNEDYIKELTSSFQPVVVSDVNFRKSIMADATYQPLLVPFVDVKMEHEFIEFKQTNPFAIEIAGQNNDDNFVYLTYILNGIESYDPNSTDDGNSPLQNHDWGLTVGILRTGDGGAGVENYDPDYDGFGNWRWKDIADNYCISADTMDQRGTWLGKTDQANTFSLKMRAWKPFLYYIDANNATHVTPYDAALLGKPIAEGSPYVWLLPCIDDERNELTGAITKRIRSRGLADVMLPEYIHFLLNRTPYKVKMLCEVAELANIPQHWLRRFIIDGKIVWINKLSYRIAALTGLSEVEMEVYAV